MGGTLEPYHHHLVLAIALVVHGSCQNQKNIIIFVHVGNTKGEGDKAL